MQIQRDWLGLERENYENSTRNAISFWDIYTYIYLYNFISENGPTRGHCQSEIFQVNVELLWDFVADHSY